MKYQLLIVLIVMLSERVSGQTDLSYTLKKYTVSGSTLVHGQHLDGLDLENHPLYMIRSTGALVDWMLNKSPQTFKQLCKQERNVLSIGIDNSNTAGSHIHHEGRRQSFGKILAGGELHIKHAGTLYGKAIYRNGQKQDIHLNYAVYPEDYAPYLVSDTLGKRRMNQEIYTVMSGFSFPFRGCHFGTEAFYEGTAQAGRKDPKHSNYTHLMRIGFSIAKTWQHDALAVRFVPEWSQQHITAKSLQDGVRFFEFYGFGLWNRRESKSAIVYNRTQNLSGFSTHADWFHDGQWHWAASAGYLFRQTHTEVSAFKNLSSSETHHLHQQLIVSRRFQGWELLLRLEAMENMRSGQEHVYEQQMQNKEQGLYDYVKVGTNRLYSHDWYIGDLKTKLIYHASPMSAIGITGGATWKHSKEHYKTPEMTVINRQFIALLGADYKKRTPKSQIEVEVYAKLGSGWNNKYSLLGQSTELQQSIAFIPYLLKGENHQQTGGSIAYACNITSQQAIGGKFAFSYLNSDYRQVIICNAAVFLTF